MEENTTQKCSYMPVCPPVKEIHPWSVRPKFQFPNVPMETDTVQRTSFAPPGRFIEDGCHCDAGSACPPCVFPTAGIC